jgi:hypothetical protein
VLKNIWEDNALGPYDEVGTATITAEHIPRQYIEKHGEIVELIERIYS